MKRKIVIASLFSLALAACGGASSGGSGKATDQPHDDTGANSSNPSSSGLAGSWYQACFPFMSYYVTNEFDFTGSSFTQMYKTYSDVDCQILTEEVSFSGTYSVVGTMVTQSGVTAHKIDFAYDELGMRYTLYYLSEGKLYWAERESGSSLTEDERSTAINFSTYATRI